MVNNIEPLKSNSCAISLTPDYDSNRERFQCWMPGLAQVIPYYDCNSGRMGSLKSLCTITAIERHSEVLNLGYVESHLTTIAIVSHADVGCRGSLKSYFTTITIVSQSDVGRLGCLKSYLTTILIKIHCDIECLGCLESYLTTISIETFRCWRPELP